MTKRICRLIKIMNLSNNSNQHFQTLLTYFIDFLSLNISFKALLLQNCRCVYIIYQFLMMPFTMYNGCARKSTAKSEKHKWEGLFYKGWQRLFFCHILQKEFNAKCSINRWQKIRGNIKEKCLELCRETMNIILELLALGHGSNNLVLIQECFTLFDW